MQPPTDTPRPERSPRRHLPATAERALAERFGRLLAPREIRTSEHTFIVVLAALVGLYGGLAAGLFSTAISLLRIAFFRTGDLVAFLRGAPEPWARFRGLVGSMDWHPELAVAALALALVAFGWGVVLGGRERTWGRRVVTVATIGGIGVVLYYSALFAGALDRTFLPMEGGFLAIVREAPWPLVLFAPAIGGLAVGLLVERFSPESRGHGVSEVLEAIAIHHSRIPAKIAIFKGLTAALTTASGGSVGREGPVVQIGSAVGSSIGRHLGVSRTQLRTLVGCGAAAGISASFDAPIAGAMFALEILLADFGVATFSPIVLSSVMATVVSRALYFQAHLATGDMVAANAMQGRPREIAQTTYQLVSPLELGPYLVLGLACGVIALAYVAALDRAETLFEGRWGGFVGRFFGRVPRPYKPALGGLLLGVLGLFVPHVLGTGYETMNAALRGQLTLGLTLVVLAAKLVATPLTLGSGGSGGSFFPAVFLGAMAGSAFGAIVHALFPMHTAASGAYALVGMGALVAGATQGPLTGIVMMFELTGDYAIILPLMVSCLAASLLINRWLGRSMYTLGLARRGIDPQAGRELDVLRRIPVHEAMSRSFELVPRTLRFRDLLHRMAATPHTTYVVVDEDGRFMGIVSFQDVRQFLFEEALSDLVVVGELARRDVPTLDDDEDLQDALERIAVVEFDHLPVVSKDDPRRVVGMLSRRDILRAYRGDLRPH